MIKYKDFCFEVLNGFNLDLIKYDGQNKNIVIPSVIDEKYKVTSINETAFKDNYRVNTLVIPNTIENIDISAFKDFYYTILFFEHDEIPKNFKNENNLITLSKYEREIQVNNIKYALFKNKKAILLDYLSNEFNVLLDKYINKNYELSAIAPYAFIDKKIKTIDFNKLSLDIYNGAFFVCNDLEELYNYENISYMGEVAFYGTSIKEFKMPEKINTIKTACFSHCEELENIKFNENLVSIEQEAFFSNYKLKDVPFPQNLEHIGLSAFAHNDNLTHIIIPKSVKRIDDFAFSGISSLVAVVILNDEVSIGTKAFSDNEYLKIYTNYYHPVLDKVYVWDDKYHIYYGVREVKELNGIVYLVTEYDLVLVIGYHFKKIKAKTYIESFINDIEVTKIIDCAFYKANMESIFIPKTITNLGNFTFKRCKYLKEIHLEQLIEIKRNIITDAENVKFYINFQEKEIYKN